MADVIERRCPLCAAHFKWGPHRFDGRKIEPYDIIVCNACWQRSWSGWGQPLDKGILQHLTERGLPIPERNERGLLPRE